LAAIAATPTMLWWPDYIARGLGHGTVTGAHYWLVYGLAAFAGPALCGRFGDWLGAGRALTIVLGLQIAGLALPLFVSSPVTLLTASLLAGGTAIGGSALVLTRTRELAGEAAGWIWRISTACFGGAQALSGFGLARLYDATGSHIPLLIVGAVAAVGAFLLSRR
jgi:predicted MFS family arabinose efflux permease